MVQARATAAVFSVFYFLCKGGGEKISSEKKPSSLSFLFKPDAP
jgi:hypothetical protein